MNTSAQRTPMDDATYAAVKDFVLALGRELSADAHPFRQVVGQVVLVDPDAFVRMIAGKIETVVGDKADKVIKEVLRAHRV